MYKESKLSSKEPISFLFQAMKDSIKSRFLPDGCLDTEKIRQFFQDASENKNDLDIFDAEKESYGDILRVLIDGLNIVSVVDIGCGNGSLLHFFNRGGIQFERYLGVDLYIGGFSQNVLDDRVSFREGDFRNIVYPKSSSVFMINVLAYINEISTINNFVCESYPERVFVVEPYPSVIWENRFSEISPKYRSLPEIEEYFHKVGYSASKVVTLYFRKVVGLHFIPISYGALFERHDSIHQVST